MFFFFQNFSFLFFIKRFSLPQYFLCIIFCKSLESLNFFKIFFCNFFFLEFYWKFHAVFRRFRHVNVKCSLQTGFDLKISQWNSSIKEFKCACPLKSFQVWQVPCVLLLLFWQMRTGIQGKPAICMETRWNEMNWIQLKHREIEVFVWNTYRIELYTICIE